VRTAVEALRSDGAGNGVARPREEAPSRRSRLTWLLPVGAIVLVLGAVVAVMSHSEPRLAGSNNVRLAGYPVVIGPGERFCQTGERIPADASYMALEGATEDRPGPPLRVTLDGRATTIPAGYRDGPLRIPVAGEAAGATLCVSNQGERRVFLGGQDAALALPPGLTAELDGEQVSALARGAYWRDGRESGWAIAGEAIDRWTRVTAVGGVTPWLAIALLIGSCVAAVVLAMRGRASAVAVGLVAIAAAGFWALTTPPFHVPDEPQHIAYAQYLAETGKLPRPVPGAVFSPEEGAAFAGVQFNNVVGNETGRPPWFADQDREIDRQLAADPGSLPDGAGTNTTANPPLYYALEIVPYKLASGGDFLDRLLAMRLLSVLLAGLTGAFAFLFVRELLPGTPYAWAAGGLAFAVQPLFGFISGGVSNDAALFATGAAVLWLVARAFRRGLDRPTAIGIGTAMGLGLIAKPTIAGLAPGLLVAFGVLVSRARDRRAVWRLAGLAVAAGAVPVVIYVVLNAAVWDRSLWSSGVPGRETGTAGHPAELTGYLGYLWQFYLPRLPFMADQQAGLPLYNVWFEGLIGEFGWLDTHFPAWVYSVAAGVFAVVAALAAAALMQGRAALSRRRGELLAYAAIVIGFLFMVGWAGYGGRLSNGFIFEQTRYLLPLGALYAGLVALAARGARRLGPAVGATLVVLACGHALLAALLVVGRFYA
jgi:predicted membrane protein DUF2142